MADQLPDSKTIKIPIVFNREGKIDSAYYESDEGENRTDIALLYEGFDYDETVIEAEVEVEVPIKKLFERQTTEGSLSYVKTDEGDPAADPDAIFVFKSYQHGEHAPMHEGPMPWYMTRKDVRRLYEEDTGNQPPPGMLMPDVIEHFRQAGFHIEVKT